MTSPTEETRKRIVVGVGGGIAAYKAIELVRLLKEQGFFISPVLTSAAKEFVGELTFSALASEPARSELFADKSTPIPHTYLGQNADAIVVVPTTAHLLARLAMGIADDLLSATILRLGHLSFWLRRCIPRCGSNHRCRRTFKSSDRGVI